MAKVTSIDSQGNMIETVPMPCKEARELYEDLKSSGNVLILQFL